MTAPAAEIVEAHVAEDVDITHLVEHDDDEYAICGANAREMEWSPVMVPSFRDCVVCIDLCDGVA